MKRKEKEKVNFSQLVQTNRKAIMATGCFSASLLTLYIQGKRQPSYESARIIAAVCSVPVLSLPWSRVERNKP